ncbi:hemolysin III [Pancytospora philotis]|nr:hemolysin III [Pancytospora philotis]
MDKQEILIKPKYRGVLHGFAFACTVLSSALYAVSATLYKFNLSLLIYLISQLLQFGISSAYHTRAWRPRMRRFMQHLDHICIFILISGTQTSVIISLIDTAAFPLARLAIKVSWAVSLVGILKILILNRLDNIFDLVVYIAHGFVLVPFYKILAACEGTDKLLIALGAALYLVGGVVYGLERPDPLPLTFGYHEIFHLLTIAANLCFTILLTRKYVLSLL